MENRKEKKETPWWQSGLVLFVRLSGWIVGPVMIAIFIGKWLDKKYKSEPWLFLVSVGVAFFFSTFGIIRDSMMEIKKIEKEVESKKVENDYNKK